MRRQACEILRTGIAVGAVCGLVAACDGRTLQVARATDLDADSALFAAVVRVIADSASLPIRVDPRVGGQAVDDEGWPQGWVDAPGVVEMRRRVLSAQGVASGPADIPKGCVGATALDPNNDRHRGCPREYSIMVVIALPRSTSPYAPANLRSYQAFRTREVRIGPDGFNDLSVEYIFASRHRGWMLAKREPLVVAE